MLRVLKYYCIVSCCQLFDHLAHKQVPLRHDPLPSFLRIQCHWHRALPTVPMTALGIDSRGSCKTSEIKHCVKQCAILPVKETNILKTTCLEYNVFV
jgi:hypothetical protein